MTYGMRLFRYGLLSETITEEVIKSVVKEGLVAGEIIKKILRLQDLYLQEELNKHKSVSAGKIHCIRKSNH